MNYDNFDGLKERLDELIWPCHYMYKFIVPSENEQEILSIFKNAETSSRPSRNGKYISITSTIFSASSEDVLTIYRAAAKVEGVIAL